MVKTIVTSLFSLFCALVIVSCGCEIETDIENMVTISQGFFGQAVAWNDIEGECDEYITGDSRVEIFLDEPTSASSPLKWAQTKKLGFFELAVAKGTYWACMGYHWETDNPLRQRCHQIAVPVETVRCDYAGAAGLGKWGCATDDV